MTAIRLGALLALLLGPTALLAARRGIRPERSLAPTMCAQALLLYAAGLLLPLDAGLYALSACSLGCWAGALWACRTHPLQALRTWLTPGLCCFVLLFPLLYWGAIERVYISYDEFSHWGLAVKLMNGTGRLFGSPESAPFMLYDYPPALSLVEWLFCRLLGAREGVALFGYQVLLCALALPLAGETRWRRPLRAAVSLLLPLLVLNAVFPLWTSRLFCEPALAMLTALLFVSLALQERPLSGAGEALILCFLTLTKNTGVFFAALYLLAAWYVRGRRALHAGVPALLAFASWQAYCALCGLGSAFSSGIAQNVSALLGGALPEANASAPLRFLLALFTSPYRPADIYGGYGLPVPPALLYALAAGLCVLGARCLPPERRRHARRAVAALFALCLCYLLFIALSYLLIFRDYEAARLSEFDRYTTLPALLCGLVGAALCLRAAWEAGSARAVQAARAVCIACTCGLLCVGNTRFFHETVIARESVVQMQWQRYTPGELAAAVRAQAPQGSSIVCLGGGNVIALRYELAPDYEVSVPGGDFMASPDMNLQTVRESLDACDYAVVLWADERLAPLVAGDLCADSLYRVEHGPDGPRLELLFSVPPVN